MPRKAPDLAPRARPVQKRAHKTVEHLLDTSARLLDEVGVDGFNTNLLAERAGVGVRTVYRYFPNKLAIVTALAERMAELERGFIDSFAAGIDGSSDWRAVVSAMLDGYLDGTRLTPGLLPVRRAVQALPELRDVEREANQRLARTLSTALRARGLDVPARRLRAVARTLAETTTALVARAREDGGNGHAFDTTLIAELRVMLESYLAVYLEPRAAKRRAASSVSATATDGNGSSGSTGRNRSTGDTGDTGKTGNGAARNPTRSRVRRGST